MTTTVMNNQPMATIHMEAAAMITIMVMTTRVMKKLMTRVMTVAMTNNHHMDHKNRHMTNHKRIIARAHTSTLIANTKPRIKNMNVEQVHSKASL